jgi:cell division protein ZapB
MSRSTMLQEFDLLETRLQEIVTLCIELRLENQALKAQHTALIEERARLIEKNETARSKVEQMIIRLKSMETSQ